MFEIFLRWLKHQQDYIAKTEQRSELASRMVESSRRFLIMSEKVNRILIITSSEFNR